MKHLIGLLVLASFGCGSVSPAGGDDPGTGGEAKAMPVAGMDGGASGAAGTAPDAGTPQGSAGAAPDGGAGAPPDVCGAPVLPVAWTITDLATLAPVSCAAAGSPDIRVILSGDGFPTYSVVLPCAPGSGQVDISSIPSGYGFFSYDIRVETPANTNARAAWARGDMGQVSSSRIAVFQHAHCGATATGATPPPFQIVVGVPASCDPCAKAERCCTAATSEGAICPTPGYDNACNIVFGDERDAALQNCVSFNAIAWSAAACSS